MKENALGNPREQHSDTPKCAGKKVKLGDVVEIEKASTPSGSKVWLLNLDAIEKDTGNVLEKNRVKPDSVGASTVAFTENAVLYSKLRPNLNKVVVADEPGLATSEMLPLVAKSEVLDRYYLAYFLRSKSFVNLAVSSTAGSKMPRLNKKTLLEAIFSIPDLETQYQRVRLLASIEKTREQAKLQIAQLDFLVKSRFIEMFNEVKQTSTLEKLIAPETRISYGIVQPGPEGTGDMGVLRPVDIADGCLCLDAVKRIDRAIGDSYRRTELTGDEILTIVRGATGQTVRSGVGCAGMNVTRGIAVIRYEPSLINPDYLVEYMNSDDGKRYIADHTQGATLQQINIADLRVMPILVPPMEIQQEFAAFVSQVDKLRFATQQQIDKLETLKKSLMQEFFE